jgi:hypothetical protein
MKFVFERNDQYARCRPNCCGEQKGDERDRSDDPCIMWLRAGSHSFLDARTQLRLGIFEKLFLHKCIYT